MRPTNRSPPIRGTICLYNQTCTLATLPQNVLRTPCNLEQMSCVNALKDY